jgi:hypothetical protein
MSFLGFQWPEPHPRYHRFHRYIRGFVLMISAHRSAEMASFRMMMPGGDRCIGGGGFDFSLSLRRDPSIPSDRVGTMPQTIRGGVMEESPPIPSPIPSRHHPEPDRPASANPSTELSKISGTTFVHSELCQATGQTQAMPTVFWDDPWRRDGRIRGWWKCRL